MTHPALITRFPAAFLAPSPTHLRSTLLGSSRALLRSSPPVRHNWTPALTSCKLVRPSKSRPSTSSAARARRSDVPDSIQRHLASVPSVVPDGRVHPLKGDVTPSSPSLTSPDAPFEPPKDAAGRVLLKGMTLGELEKWVASALSEKPFRARQLWRWLYRADKVAGTFDEMTDLSKTFREKLAEVARVDALSPGTAAPVAADGTRKLTYTLSDGNGAVESVLIPADGRATLCVSSQWGCALNCQFCLTGLTGFKRNLTTGEIVDQVVLAKRFFEKPGSALRISNIVFMGEGEPAHNLDNVMRAVETLISPDGLQISHNKITVSTSGLVPEIRLFAAQCKANLAVSLHATNDELRSWLMPINRKYNLEELMGTLRDVFPRDSARQQKVFFQYVMLKGVNDSLQDAKQLLRITSGVPCKINLIHFNPHDGTLFEGSDDETILAFQDFLVKKGMTVTVRKSRGDEKMMACGQLGKVGEKTAPRMRVPEKYAHAIRQPKSIENSL